MKLPFSIEKQYQSTFTSAEIKNIIEENNSEKHFGGLRVDEYNKDYSDKSFVIRKYSFGLTAFIPSFPTITGKIQSEKPTVLNIKLVPNYFSIAFFLFFVIVFTSVSLFSNKNNLGFTSKESETFKRLANFIGGAVIPGIICYLRYIRPVKTTEKWIKEKLSLTEQ